MSEQNIIEIRNLKKEYKLGVINTGSLVNDLKSWKAKKGNKVDPNSKVETERFFGEKFYALNGVNLDVKKGEALGIIGGNGAGKSTLLKILSRITSPTEGEAVIRGRVTSMLEIGTGFNGELTGRENIYLNGAILGMSRKEIDSKLDEIIEFSECREFIDTPVKRYSSGMYVKLAFSVAAHLDSEIMIMDEVLAVGDVAFQRKCINKMIDAIHDDNKTVLYVSHNMATVQALCSRCVVLKAGKIIFDGSPEDAIAIYSGINMETFLKKEFTDNSKTSYGIYTDSIELLDRSDTEFTAGQTIRLKLKWGTNTAENDIVIGAVIMRGNTPIQTSFSKPIKIKQHTPYESILEVDTSSLVDGKYTINLTFCRYTTPNIESFYIQQDSFIFNIVENEKQNKISWRNDLWGNVIGKNMPITMDEKE